MQRLISDGQQEKIYQAFSKVSLSDSKTATLEGILETQEAGEEILKLMELARDSRMNTFMLANGNMLKRTSTTMLATTNSGTESKLCNVGISIDEIMFGEEGINYTCKLRCEDADIPTIRTRLSETDFDHYKKLQVALRRAFMSQGYAPYVACYNRAGYLWPDILAKLSEGLKPKPDTVSLGVDGDLILQLPNITIDPRSKTIEPQTKILEVSPQVTNAYRGLDHYSDINPIDPYKTLFGMSDNIYVLGFVAGISHMVHQIVTGYEAAKEGRPFTPSHLFYVEPENGIWGPIYRQLCQMLTGSSYVPQLPAKGLNTHLNEMKGLGPLPYFASMPPIGPQTVHKAVFDSPVGLITTLDWRNACVVTDDPRTSFVVAPDHTELPAELSTADLVELQRVLPTLLLHALMTERSAGDVREFLGASTPAEVGYRYLCKMLNVEPQDAFLEVVQNYYTAMIFTGVPSFFHSLYELIYAQSGKKENISVVNAAPTPENLKSNPAEAYLTEDRVFLSHRMVDIINLRRKSVMKFSNLSLTEEMRKLNYLVGPLPDTKSDPKRYWIIDREVWDKYVMKKPIQLGPVTSGNIIQLPRIA
jgi:hypothetical protein